MKLQQLLQAALTKSNLLVGLCFLLMEVIIACVVFPSFSSFFYALVSGLLIFAGVSIWLQLKQKRVFLMLLIIGAAFFLTAKTAILETEFWGDEIGVIQIAQSKFSTIAELAITRHVAVPPLDYQNLHWWLLLTKSLPASQQEFVWRVPYMLMHIVTAIFFAFIVLANLDLSRRENMVFTFIVFLTYLTNPLFFVYGFEIRFYALSLLGLMLVFYGYVKQKTTSFWWIVIALFSSLNSAIFPIFIMLFAGTALLPQSERSRKLAFWLTLIVCQLIILVSFSRTLSFPNTMILFQWELFSRALDQFARSSLFLLTLLPIAINAWTQQYKQLLKEIPSHTYIMLVSSLSFIAVIFICFIVKPHSDVGIRHFILGIPAVLIFLYQTIVISHKNLAIGIFSTVLIVQLVVINQGFKHHELVGKDFMYIKNAFEIATAQNIPVVFLKPAEMHPDLQSFYELTLKWYSKRYQISYQFLTLEAETCQKTLLNYKESIFIKGESSEIPCIPKEPIQLLEYRYQ